MDAENITLQRISAQHSLAGFHSGDDESDMLAAGLLNQVRGRGLEDWQYVVVATELMKNEVVGILASSDLWLTSIDASGAEVSDKYLFIYLLAVNRNPSAPMVLRVLLTELDEIRERRFAHDAGYRGVLTAPLRGVVAADDGLKQLASRGFRQVEDTMLLVRSR